MSTSTDDDLRHLGEQLTAGVPAGAGLDRVRTRGAAIRQRRRRAAAGVATALVVLAAIPLTQRLAQPDVAPVDFADTPPTVDATDTSGIDASSLPDAVIAVVGQRDTTMGDPADWGLITLDGGDYRMPQPVFRPGDLLGADVPARAVARDFVAAWHVADPQDPGSCQVGVGRDAEVTLGFDAAPPTAIPCPAGVAIAPDADVLVWNGVVDGQPRLEWMQISPPAPDVPGPSSMTVEPDGTIIGSASTGAPGRAVLIGEVTTLPLDGPADLALDDWTVLDEDRGLLTYRSPAGLWEQIVTRTADGALQVAPPTPVPPTEDGLTVIGRAATSSQPAAPTTTLLHDPATGAVLLRSHDGTTTTVGTAESDTTRWSLTALDRAAVVSDGQTGWLFIDQGTRWTAPRPLAGEVRQAHLMPSG